MSRTVRADRDLGRESPSRSEFRLWLTLFGVIAMVVIGVVVIVTSWGEMLQDFFRVVF